MGCIIIIDKPHIHITENGGIRCTDGHITTAIIIITQISDAATTRKSQTATSENGRVISACRIAIAAADCGIKTACQILNTTANSRTITI